MIHNRKKQQGMTGTGWLAILFLIGFFALLTFRLAPIYLENYSVKNVLESLKEEPLITQNTKKQVLSMLFARLNTNGIKTIKGKMIKIDKKPGYIKINIDYFVRKPMVGNVDVVVSFNEEVELVSN
jgi:hypothetical protein